MTAERAGDRKYVVDCGRGAYALVWWAGWKVVDYAFDWGRC